MIARVGPSSNVAIHADRSKVAGQCRADEEMVYPEPGVAAEGVPQVLPECVNALVRMQVPDGVDSAVVRHGGERLAHLRPEQSIIPPPFWSVDIQVSRHNVEVSGEHDRQFQFEKTGSV